MRIAILGYGKMGKKIEEMALEMGHEIACIVYTYDDLVKMKSIDVAIEFTHPESAFSNIKYCIDHNIPVVCGTTGWLNQFELLKRHCLLTNGSLFYASNFSIGMNIAFKMNQLMAQMIPEDYTVAVEEIHHTEKRDSPSGTAITLANTIIEQRQLKGWINENSNDPETLPIISKRIDKVPGTHFVRYESKIDKIEISHTAKSRDGFVLGAIKAAEWLVDRKGVFGMSDMIDSQTS